jgi:glycosyltransferase involved in cell wall biosynthesis
MTEPGSTLLVVPCYNEAQRIDIAAYRKFLTEQSKVALVFVDDGSTDGTAEVLEQVRSGLEPVVHILRLPRNQGKAQAVRQGILFALEQFEPAVVGYWDADLATPLDAVSGLRAVLDGRPDIEMVFGARVQLLGRFVQRSAIRHYLGRIFATAASVVLEVPIYDTQCGAKLFRVRPQTVAIFAEPFLSKWVFDVEILARYRRVYLAEGAQLANKVYEYPLECWIDVAGSKVHPADFFTALRDVIRIRRAYFRE